ncbi:HK97-gp10 family putative phage morphogenesis protein [Pseudalkalibacillus sp. JSM 102089]|uniref:HK97-gp10 family putative phage morphogenesis protein n=1 Tax=Pseudalkalibacillus sp. JSM 102089 TaxID=3229856 RepID=UPI0035242B6B
MTELISRLESMGSSIDENLTDKALQAGSEIVKEKVRNHPNMPVSNGSGPHARDNIGIKKMKKGQFDIGAREEFFYLLFHEVGAKGGTYKGKDGKKYKIPNISAKPFMRPAFETHKNLIETAMGEVIKRELGL